MTTEPAALADPGSAADRRAPEQWLDHYAITAIHPRLWRGATALPWTRPISLAEFYQITEPYIYEMGGGAWLRLERDVAKLPEAAHLFAPQPAPPPRAEPKPEPERKPVSIGTGMPATTLLEMFGQWVREAFGATAYHVGSSIHGKQWRDVDVRLMLPDDEFAALFPGYEFGKQGDAKWALLCAALSELGQRLTGLPVDFQIQSVTDGNRLYPKPRNPLRLFTHASAQAEIQRRAQAAAGPEPDGQTQSSGEV